MITNKLLIAKRMKLELCISITIRYMATYLNKHNFIILSSCSPPNSMRPFPLCTVSPLSKCVSKKKKKTGIIRGYIDDMAYRLILVAVK